MKKTLKSLSLIAAFALMATIIPLLRGGGFTAYAASDFTVENGVLTKYTGDDATVTIPSTVTRIKSTAFQSSHNMTKIVIPTSVTTIDNTAFDRCSKLKEFSAAGNSNFCTTEGGVLFTRDLKKIVKYPPARTNTSFKIPNSVTTIGNSSFYNAENLTSVTVQSGVTTIEKWGFCSMDNLQTITLPDTLKTIGVYAFGSDKSMASISIPSSVTTLGEHAFYNCTSLGVVTIPSSVTSMGSYAFEGCTSLKTVYLSTGLNTIESYAFNGCTGLTSIGIPGSVKKINERAFNGCTGAKTITIGPSVTEIGEGAFAGCTGVSYVTIPESVTKIGKYAFSGCTNMKYISINSKAPEIMAGGDILQSCPIEAFSYIGTYTDWTNSGWKYITCLNTSEVGNYLGQKVADKAFYGFTESGTSRSIASFVTSILSGAFAENGDMASLGLPDSLSSYNRDVFDDCTKLQSFSISSSNTKYKVVDGVLYTKDGKTLIRYPIAKSGTSFTVPSTVTKIGYSAFYKNANLTKVVMNSPVAVIDEYAFDATKLTTIDIPASVTTVNKYAFGSISGTISKVTIRAKDASVNSTAFSGDTITTVNYCDTSPNWDNSVWKTALDGKYSKIYYLYQVTDGKLVEYFGYSTGFAVPSGVTEISSGAFSRSPQMNAITISETVTTIPASTFDALKSLTAINVNANNTTFKSDGGVLFTKDGKTILRYPIAKTGTSYSIPTTVTTIGNSAFYWVRNLESITIPSSVTKVEAYGFDSCPKIKIEFSSSKWGSLTNVSGKTKYCNSEVNDYTIVKYNDSTATSVNLPDFATYIKNGALPATLKTVILPKALTGYDAYLFDSLKALTAINLQSGNTSFKSVSGVLFSYDGKTLKRYPIAKTSESYTIPDGVTTIANSAFYNCANLKTVTIPSSVTTIENYGLATGTKLSTLKINAKNPTIASTNALLNTTVTTVNYNGTMAEWKASSWKSALDGKYTSLILTDDIKITQQPQSKTITEGQSLTLEVKATGNNLTYQWYFKKKDQTSFSVWNNRTHASETVTPNSSWNGIQLYCLIKDSDGRSLRSNTVTITVNTAALAITTQPTNQYIVLGKPVTVSLKATGSGLKYQWYFKKKGQTSFSVWNGRTHASETCTPNATWDGIQLYCKVTDSAGNSVNSKTITVYVLSVSLQPKSQTVKSGSTITLSVAATGSSPKYQWYFKKSGQSAFSVWNGRTHAVETVTPNDTWNGIQLYCLVKDSAGNSVKSNTVTIKFGTPAVKITTQPKNQTVTAGNTIKLSLTASGDGLTYQWYYKKSGQSTWSVWNGRTHATESVAPNSSWNGIQLYCVVMDSAGGSVTSNTITITVK